MAQASTDLIATGVLDYRCRPETEERWRRTANQDDLADISKAAT